MKFIDSAKVFVRSGKGGAGCTSFRREKFIEFGGPNGGDGGNGGNILFQGDFHLGSLQDLTIHPHQFAGNGKPGTGSQRKGKEGESKIIRVPLGTIVTNDETDEILWEILNEEPHPLLKGGRGGLGNMHFKSSRNQAPQHHQPGEPGLEMSLRLELKIMADVGLVGFPNAGKSTLISTISRAHPKIGDYPFTTLIPNLGVVQMEDFRSFVVADIPGIIEGSHEGHGLGHRFLKHIQRTSLLAFLLDGSGFSERLPLETYKTLLNELESFSPDLLQKKRVILLTKIDALSHELDLEQIKEEFREMGEEILPISSISRSGIQSMLRDLSKIVQEEKEKIVQEEKEKNSD